MVDPPQGKVLKTFSVTSRSPPFSASTELLLIKFLEATKACFHLNYETFCLEPKHEGRAGGQDGSEPFALELLYIQWL